MSDKEAGSSSRGIVGIGAAFANKTVGETCPRVEFLSRVIERRGWPPVAGGLHVTGLISAVWCAVELTAGVVVASCSKPVAGASSDLVTSGNSLDLLDSGLSDGVALVSMRCA